jgi:ATP-dependent Clp protease ATP-binding subunit ClpC
MSDDAGLTIADLAGRLRAKVVGQDHACQVCASILARFKAGLTDPERPTGSLLFVGPTGVGKTELAKQLARVMFGDERRLVRFDMSEYASWGSAARLVDVSPGTASLARRIAEEPLAVVLLDEIEKAHAEVFDLLLGVLGEGRLTDADGRLVDFRAAIVIMTSNLGVRDQPTIGFGGGSSRAWTASSPSGHCRRTTSRASPTSSWPRSKAAPGSRGAASACTSATRRAPRWRAWATTRRAAPDR